jgi:hypothetical protein
MRTLAPMMICTAVISSVSSGLIAVASADIYLDESGEKLICLGKPLEKTFRVLVNAVISFGSRDSSMTRNHVPRVMKTYWGMVKENCEVAQRQDAANYANKPDKHRTQRQSRYGRLVRSDLRSFPGIAHFRWRVGFRTMRNGLSV